MKSFWNLSTIDKCTVLARLVQRLSGANLTSLQLLAEARGESPTVIWQRCCVEAGVEPCALPHHLLGCPDEATYLNEQGPVLIPRDTAGYAARSKVVTELQKSKAFQARHLRAHAG